MSNYLNPIAATEEPRRDFIRYLLTEYSLRDSHLRYGFKKLLEQVGNVWQTPYLEGSQPYESGQSIRQLEGQRGFYILTSSIFCQALAYFTNTKNRQSKPLLNRIKISSWQQEQVQGKLNVS